MPQFFLSESDVEMLKRFRDYLHSTRRNGRAGDSPPDDFQSTDVYIAKVPTGGIAGIYEPVGTGSNSEPSYAVCQVYSIYYNSTSGNDELLAVTGLTPRVYNIGEEAIAADSWVVIAKTKFGQWVTDGTTVGGGSLEYAMWYLDADLPIVFGTTRTLQNWTKTNPTTSATYPTFPSAGIWQYTYTVTGEVIGTTGPAILQCELLATGAASIIGLTIPKSVVCSGLVAVGGNYPAAGTGVISVIVDIPNPALDGIATNWEVNGALAVATPVFFNGTIYTGIWNANSCTMVTMHKIA
jgi:hypothetical protein